MTAAHGGHWLEREDVGDVTVVRLKLARPTDEDVNTFFKQIYVLIDDMGRRNLVLDMHAVEYVTSMALGKLIMLNRKAQAAGGRLVLCSLTPAAEEIMKLTRLRDLFTVCPNEPEALALFFP
jgi:anti-sigma B factor antagonist